MKPSLARSIEACQSIAAAKGTSFLAGMKLCPEPSRSGMFVVYAWTRLGDDLADDAGDASGKADAVRRFGERTLAVLDGGEPGDGGEVFEALRWVVDEFGVERAWIEQMLDGLSFDAEERLDGGFETGEALEAYCDRVAGTVGRMCVSIWGLRDGVGRDEALRLASVQGYGFQMTNILRDVIEDWERAPRRLYLDAEMLAAHGLNPGDFIGAVRAGDGRALGVVRDYADRAERAFAEADALGGMISGSCEASWWAMTAAYRGILDCIVRDPAAVAGRIELGAAEKARIVATAAAKRVLPRPGA